MEHIFFSKYWYLKFSSILDFLQAYHYYRSCFENKYVQVNIKLMQNAQLKDNSLPFREAQVHLH